MLPKWQSGIILDIIKVTPEIWRFQIELPETPSFDFQPGQFITVDFPINEQRNKRWRSYSIASMPDDGNIIELIIAYVNGGVASEYIFNNLKKGNQITLRGPSGTFVLPDVAEKDLFLICTGTGIAPFRSMIHYVLEKNIPHNRINLIFGTRTRDTLLYEKEMRGLADKYPEFSYLPVLSRENWDGLTGYVHPVYEKLCSEKQPAVFMLCGWRAMVDEAILRIEALGYPRKEIIVELYG